MGNQEVIMWILLVLFWSNAGIATAQIEFTSKTRCEEAIKTIDKKKFFSKKRPFSGYIPADYICLKK